MIVINGYTYDINYNVSYEVLYHLDIKKYFIDLQKDFIFNIVPFLDARIVLYVKNQQLVMDGVITQIAPDKLEILVGKNQSYDGFRETLIDTLE